MAIWSEEGLIATMTFDGSLNTASFLVFLAQILLPKLWVGAIVAMDNLPVRYAETAIALIESVGAQVKFLPTYSPDLSGASHFCNEYKYLNAKPSFFRYQSETVLALESNLEILFLPKALIYKIYCNKYLYLLQR